MTETKPLIEPARRVHFDSVDSTNREALDRARAGDPGNLWITSGEQTSGRGRRGRAWSSPLGNLHASLLIVEPSAGRSLATLPLAAAVAVHDAIAAATNAAERLAIKWPNDILLDGAKLSGLLLEAEALPGDRSAIVIGCGVNCVSHPETGLYPATDLAAAGWDMTAEVLFPHLAAAFEHVLHEWREGGAAAVRDPWLARAQGLGQPIRINRHDGFTDGVFAGIDAEGYLLLSQPGSGTIRISAGDLFFQQGHFPHGQH